MGKDKKEKKVKKSKKEPTPLTAVAPSVDAEALRKKIKKKLKKELGRKPTAEEVDAKLAKKLKKAGGAAPAAAAEPDRKRKRDAGGDSTPKAKAAKGGSGTPATAAEIAKYRKETLLTVTGTSTAEDDYPPAFNFVDSGITQQLLKFCGQFAKPTPIQAQVWPVIMAGVDCIGIAKTGSGKTVAFGLPGLMHVAAIKQGVVQPGRPTMCVIAPTRELAVQTHVVCEEAGATMNPPIKSVCIYGGVPKHPQCAALRKGVHIVVATPGRLYDLMEQGEVELGAVSYMVLDEADRMLDLGFEKEIKHFMGSCSPTKQTLMFSATWPKEVQAIGGGYMKRPIRVTVGDVDRLTSNHAVSQTVEVMEGRQKDARLSELLAKFTKDKSQRVLIFALYKKEAARIQDQLRRRGYPGATAIHGDLSQDKRTEVLENFKSGKCKLMIATDVAARGLDVPELNYVINYTFPLTVEDYVHRVGRTGRAGKKGTSFTFFTQDDKGLAGELGNVLREAGANVPEALMNFGQGTKRKKDAYGGNMSATQEAMKGMKATRITFD